jgi:hypothetical protein
MKQKTRYVYVTTPSIVSGFAFVSSYELDEFGAHGNADLPEAQLLESARSVENSNWTQAAVRLTEAFRRLVRQPLWRKTLKPSVAA